MSKIKDLFKQHDSSGKVLSAKNISEMTSSHDAESFGYIEAYQKEKDRYFPEVDFSKPETFVKYGSAKKYHEDAISRIYRMYPYDGSHKEKVEWHNSSSYYDNYVFDNEYPRTNGYLIFDFLNGGLANSFGDNPGTGAESYILANSPQYIYIKGGPHKAAVADDIDQPEAQSYSKASSKSSYTETSANIYDVEKKRASNFAIDGADGNSLEFWFKPTPTTTSVSVFDAWNSDGTTATCIRSASYGRMLLESRYEITAPAGFVENSFMHFTYMSGTDGAERVPIFAGVSPSLDWSHIAVTVKNSGNQLNIKSYINGELVSNILTGSSISEVTGAINANLSSYRTFPTLGVSGSGLAAGVTDMNGYGTFSGSLDEFRFWKTARTSQEIGRNWFTQVYGGSNTDDANTDLGVYFKFNEGITEDNSFDAIALDYSGRISNGQIQNYLPAMRQTGSAMVEAGAASSEFLDPIIYSFHPSIVSLLADKRAEGEIYDVANPASIYNSFPNWMVENDTEIGTENLKNIVQIISNYFDTLQLQVDNLPRMKDAQYTKYTELKAENYADIGNVLLTGSTSYPAYSSSYSGKPQPFIKNALQSFGIEIPELFTDATVLEQLSSRDEDREYKDKLYNVKNQIYQNIYNNLHFIMKSKGTEKSFRNLVRCFGVDDELVRLNLYGNNVDFEFRNNFRSTAVKRSYVDFTDVDRQGATVYMMTSSGNSNSSYSYIPSDLAMVSGGFGMTFQTEVYFPNKGDEGNPFYQPYTQLSASLYGMHTAIEATPGSSDMANTTWNSPDSSEFQVYAVRPESKSPHAYFQLTSSVLGINLTSSVFDFVYDNEKWNFAVRIKPTKYPWANALTGTNSGSLASGIAADEDLSYEVSFYGGHADLDIIVDEFSLSTTVSASLGDNFMSGSKRLYIGAHRTNFTGTLIEESDVRISSTRAWMDYLTDDEIRAHAKDADNKGVLHPYRNAFVFQDSVKPYDIPRSDLLIFEWDFTNVTSSDGGISGLPTTYDARFVVEDIASGSTVENFADWIDDNRYGALRNIVRNQFTGRGDFFEPNNNQVVDHIYIHSAKQDAPEVINSSDMIEILNQDDLEFTRDSRPIDYFYAVEKSMYQTISDEMLRMFATIADFNNLIGEPVNRYRGYYKDMDKLKSLFFRNIGNSPDLDKYVEFYKWIDAAITKFLEQLFPASANYGDSLRTVVESHILERNAYRNKFPTLEVKQKDPEVSMLGIRELKYNWKFGHAPTDVSTDAAQQNNCLWFNQRAERTVPALSSSVASVNADKQTILDIATTDNSGSYLDRYEGSTYVLRKLSRPYKEGVSFSKQFKGGVNFDENKKVDYWKGLLKRGSENGILVADPQNTFVDDTGTTDKHCLDGKDKNPLGKNKLKLSVFVDDNENGSFDSYADNPKKANTVMPFNFYTVKETTDTKIDITDSTLYNAQSLVNIHHDGYGPNAEVPMQGPFSEKWEGGNQHRHIRLNDGRDITNESIYHRPEAWNYAGTFPLLTFKNQVDYGATADQATSAPYYRDFIAKRPVVIKNILQTTASVDVRLDGVITHGPIGNYSHQYDILQTSGRSQNNKYFVEQQGVGFGKVFGDLEASPEVAFYNMAGLYTFPTPERKTTDAVFVERFSAPGSYEAISRGYLDPFAEERSAYNAMPFRNLSVRGDRFKKIGAQKGGGAFTSTDPADYGFETLTITSQENNKTVVYIFQTSGTTGDLDGSGRVKVVLSGADPSAYVTELIAAINSSNGHNAGVPNSVLGLTSPQPGVIGILGLSFILYSDIYFVTSTVDPAQVEMSASIWSTSSLGLRSLLSRHTIFGGYDYEAQSDGAFHKTYRNRLRRIEMNGGATYLNPDGTVNEDYATGSVYNNAYVTHMIPRSDYQYSWITASVLSQDPSNAFGFGYFPYSGEVSSSAGGFESAVNFVTASEHGSYILNSNQERYYGINKYSPFLNGVDRYGFIPVDFVGLNTIFYDTINTDTNTISDTTLNLTFNDDWIADNVINYSRGLIGKPAALNAINLHRGGAYGYPTFKQIRNMYHPIARYLKDTNTYSISVRNPKAFISAPSVLGNSTTIFNQTVFPKLNYRNLTDNSYEGLKGQPHGMLGAELAIENYIEPPLSSKYKPIRHNLIVKNDNNELADIRIDHTYTNNYDYFANPTLMNKLNYAGVIQQPGRQVYDNLLEYTVKGTVPKLSNPIKGFKNLIYKETIYPKEAHTYLAKNRGRTNYDENVSELPVTNPLGQQRTFWKDSLTDRLRANGAYNAFNWPQAESFDSVAIVGNIAPRTSARSVWPLDTGTRTYTLSSGSIGIWGMISGSDNGQLSINDNQGYFNVAYPQASYEYNNISLFQVGSIYATDWIPSYRTAELSGKKPFFNSYEEYAADIRVMGQDHTVLPEFKISEHMDYILENGEYKTLNNFLTLEGGHLSQSADSETGSYSENFFDVYSHSDFLKHFDVIHEQHDGVAKQTKITVKCHGIKKLLPYNGFYPVTRAVQMGTLFSSSFGPYLQRSGTLSNGDSSVLPLAAMVQPLMNPGILYNTVKSGIAVDWLAFTSSAVYVAESPTSGWNFVSTEGGFRLPFETLINPEQHLPVSNESSSFVDSNKIHYTDTYFPYVFSVTQDSYHGIWTGKNKPNYSLAMNNFMAEIPNFFLNKGLLSRLESLPEASFVSGTVYYMDLELYKSDDTIMYEGPRLTTTNRAVGQTYTNESPYADPYYKNNNFAELRGIHYGPFMQVTASTAGAKDQISRYDPAPAPWTPPYFYGKATARFRFAPHEFTDLLDGESMQVGSDEGAFDISEIVAHMATAPSGVVYFNDYTLDKSGYLKYGLTNPALLTAKDNTEVGAYATKHQMQIPSSMNLFNIVSRPDLVFNADGDVVQTDTQTEKNRWVISPKFECPTLNFSNNEKDSAWGVFTDVVSTKGMWRGYANKQLSQEGIYYNLKDSFPTTDGAVTSQGNPVVGLAGASPSIGSLRQKLFGDRVPTRVGLVRQEKEISEAVVAIPFTVNGNKKIYFPFVPASDPIDQKKIGRKAVNNLLGKGDPVNPDVFVPGESLVDQVEKMQKYVFPPSLDFINNENITPIQMYIFEFTHTLDKEDLLDIWQGVMPKIARTAEKQTSSVTHFLTNNELMLGRDITKEVRWMVFKVKQKAETNFMEMRRKSAYGPTYKYAQDKDKFVIEQLDTGTGPYSYNWPYDFFSLVELAKISTGVQIGGEVPITPPDIESEPVDKELVESPKKGGPPLQIGKEYTLADNNRIQTNQPKSEPDVGNQISTTGKDPII